MSLDRSRPYSEIDPINAPIAYMQDGEKFDKNGESLEEPKVKAPNITKVSAKVAASAKVEDAPVEVVTEDIA
jgi:hypothetical protein